MTNNAESQTADLSSYAIEPKFYIGKFRNSVASNRATIYIDGTDNMYVNCLKSPDLSLTTNKRVIVMEIGGTYIVLQKFN